VAAIAEHLWGGSTGHDASDMASRRGGYGVRCSRSTIWVISRSPTAGVRSSTVFDTVAGIIVGVSLVLPGFIIADLTDARRAQQPARSTGSSSFAR